MVQILDGRSEDREKGWVSKQEEFLRQRTLLLRPPEVLWRGGDRWKRKQMMELVAQGGDGVGIEGILSQLEAKEHPTCFCVWDVFGTLTGPLSLLSWASLHESLAS